MAVLVNLRVLVLVMTAAMLPAAEPRLLAQGDLPQGVGTARRIEIDVDGAKRALLAVTLLPGSCTARLVDQSPTFPLGAVTVAQARAQVPGGVVAINGGYFEPGLQPLGLVRLGGVDRHPSSDATVLSGVVALDSAGRLSLLARGEPLTGVDAAFQAGPFVIDPGGAVGVSDRPATARRSLLAVDDHGRLLVLATGPLTLHQVATLLHDHPAVFGLERVERALNLDGGPSTGLALALADPAWSSPEHGPVRNVLVFAPIP